MFHVALLSTFFTCTPGSLHRLITHAIASTPYPMDVECVEQPRKRLFTVVVVHPLHTCIKWLTVFLPLPQNENWFWPRDVNVRDRLYLGSSPRPAISSVAQPSCGVASWIGSISSVNQRIVFLNYNYAYFSTVSRASRHPTVVPLTGHIHHQLSRAKRYNCSKSNPGQR